MTNNCIHKHKIIVNNSPGIRDLKLNEEKKWKLERELLNIKKNPDILNKEVTTFSKEIMKFKFVEKTIELENCTKY